MTLSIVSGCTATTYCPEGFVTRAQFAAMLGRAYTGGAVPVAVTAPYPDVPVTEWYAGYVSLLKGKGVIAGNSAGNFDPNGTLTRAQAAAMIARYKAAHESTAGATATAAGVLVIGDANLDTKINEADLPAATLAFIDVPTSYWAAKHISYLVKSNVIAGQADGTFGPEGTLTRAQLAAMLSRFFS